MWESKGEANEPFWFLLQEKTKQRYFYAKKIEMIKKRSLLTETFAVSKLVCCNNNILREITYMKFEVKASSS